MSRYFFALDLIPQDKLAIDHWRATALHLPFKVMDQQNFHITLAFLGEVDEAGKQGLLDEAEQIAAKLRPIKPKQLHLDNIGLFKKPRVLYLGIDRVPDWLNALAAHLSAAAVGLTLFQESRPYRAHLSLYRKANSLLIELPAVKLIININSFSLYQSISTPFGVQYKTVKSWSLIST
jgi:2'-5' RNA ligase